ncbi:MAG: uncharacterized protein JWR28_3133 [Modestobacter sp.]|nr:uncharacterized protein [Modestobacter sp.]MCW2619984.1 uncharacterized protein [Modestobacter sp.]
MSTTPRRLLIPLLVVLLLAVAVVAGLLMTRDPDATESAADSAAPSSEPLSALPEAASTQPGSQVLEPGPEQTVATDPAPVTTGGDVDVVVTYAGWDAETDVVEVSGFVSGVVEDGGTCRLTAEGDGPTVSAESTGIADASTTSCGSVVLPGGGLGAGTWQVVLSYESATSTGSSSPTTVEVTR